MKELTVRKYLIAGLLVWIPLVITGWVLKLLIDLMDQSLLLLPERFQTEAWLGFHVPGLGVFLTVVIVLNILGRVVQTTTKLPWPSAATELSACSPVV